MKIQKETIIYPLPTEEYLLKKERVWRVKLPDTYRMFIKEYSGGVPKECRFVYKNHEYVIERFLCVLSEYRDHRLGMYDIGVVITQIEDRLSDNPDLIGVEMVPIATLFAGDFVCLDFRNKKDHPSVCVWSHEESEVDSPVTYKVSDDFEGFCEMLIE